MDVHISNQLGEGYIWGRPLGIALAPSAPDVVVDESFGGLHGLIQGSR
jgi:hypothetical protein